MKNPIRLGAIGLGRAGYHMHLNELKGKEDLFTYAAVCDLEADRMESMKEQFNCKTFLRAEDLIEDPDVEVVVVSTRSCDHFKHAKTALEAGKTVFLEKPMAETYEEAKTLIELDEKTGERKLFIRHNSSQRRRNGTQILLTIHGAIFMKQSGRARIIRLRVKKHLSLWKLFLKSKNKMHSKQMSVTHV